LKTKANVSYEIETFDYGMGEFGIFDIEVYLPQFGQDIREVEKLNENGSRKCHIGFPL